MSNSTNNTKVKVENLSKAKLKLTINVTAEEFDNALDKAFEKVVKEVKVDGFRPGKMPKKMFINRFGWESLYQDAIEFAFQATYYDALKEADVYALDSPQLDLDFNTLAKGQGFTYTAIVEHWPESQVGEYKGIKVKPKSTKVTKKAINDYVKNVLKDKTEIVIKDTPAIEGDTVIIDFEGFMDEVAFEGGKAENYELELGSNSFIPGFEEQLVGVKSGDELDVNVVFPENYHEAMAGKAARFAIKVHEVKGKIYPKLDNDLVAELEIDNITTKEEYLKYVEDLLIKQKEEEAEKYLVETLLKKIIRGSKIYVPEVVLNRELDKQVERLEQQAKQYQIPVEALLQYSGMGTLDQFKEQSLVQIKQQIQEEIVIDHVIEKENFQITAEEIEKMYRDIAKIEDENAEGASEKLVKIKSQYQADVIIRHLKIQKALNLIKENAVLE